MGVTSAMRKSLRWRCKARRLLVADGFIPVHRAARKMQSHNCLSCIAEGGDMKIEGNTRLIDMTLVELFAVLDERDQSAKEPPKNGSHCRRWFTALTACVRYTTARSRQRRAFCAAERLTKPCHVSAHGSSQLTSTKHCRFVLIYNQ